MVSILFLPFFFKFYINVFLSMVSDLIVGFECSDASSVDLMTLGVRTLLQNFLACQAFLAC